MHLTRQTLQPNTTQPGNMRCRGYGSLWLDHAARHVIDSAPRHLQAYKKAALEWHPDKHADRGEVERREAEAKFKKLGEALEVLTDEFKRKLWDEGHDLDSISQRVQMRDQQQGGRR